MLQSNNFQQQFLREVVMPSIEPSFHSKETFIKRINEMEKFANVLSDLSNDIIPGHLDGITFEKFTLTGSYPEMFELDYFQRELERLIIQMKKASSRDTFIDLLTLEVFK
jgi:hypothetical protein